MPPDPTLEFDYSELRTQAGGRIEEKEVVEGIYEHITQNTPLAENDITGVQLWPSRWPRKVIISFRTNEAKQRMGAMGLDVFGAHIELSEPGAGVIRVEVQNAPLSFPNHVIKEFLENYGTVSHFRNDTHRLKSGRRISWGTGTRSALMKNLHLAIPPVANLQHENITIKVNIWFYGQKNMECRWCKLVVDKEHQCDAAPRKRCYDCGSFDHLKPDCTVGKACFKCGSREHFARECQAHQAQIPTMNNFPPLQAQVTGNVMIIPGTNKETGESTRTPSRQAGEEIPQPSVQIQIPTVEITPPPEESLAEKDVTETTPLNDISQEEDDEFTMARESEELQTEDDSDDEEKTIDENNMEWKNENEMCPEVKVLILGGSNSIGMHPASDEEIRIKTLNVSVGGMSMTRISSELNQVSPTDREAADIVVTHVGSCDIPKNTEEDLKNIYEQYLTEIQKIKKECTNASILISSVPYRKGCTEERFHTNDQIEYMNSKIRDYCYTEDRLSFCDNNKALTGSTGQVNEDLYEEKDLSGIHLNSKGKNEVTESIKNKIKDVVSKADQHGAKTLLHSQK